VQSDHIFSPQHILESVSERESKVVCLVCCAGELLKLVSRSAGPLDFWRPPGKSTTLRLGVEQCRWLCTGDLETPFLMEKLLSGKRNQSDWGLGVSLCGKSRFPGRDLIAGNQYS